RRSSDLSGTRNYTFKHDASRIVTASWDHTARLGAPCPIRSAFSTHFSWRSYRCIVTPPTRTLAVLLLLLNILIHIDRLLAGDAFQGRKNAPVPILLDLHRQ